MYFKDKDLEIMKIIIANPTNYVVCVDNDSITVSKKDDDSFYHCFSEFGQYFIEQLFRFFCVEAEQA